jgi:hypothetical protein
MRMEVRQGHRTLMRLILLVSPKGRVNESHRHVPILASRRATDHHVLFAYQAGSCFLFGQWIAPPLHGSVRPAHSLGAKQS